MALSKVASIGLFGLSGTVIDVEVDISAQLPAFVLVGLPDASLSEATSRVRAACSNSGFAFPSKKIVVNLSPASVPKSGSGFDLAIAVAVLVAMEVVPAEVAAGKVFVGELGLDGTLRSVPGVLPITLAARTAGFESVVVPRGNLGEARLVAGIGSVGCESLLQLVRMLRGEPVSDSDPLELKPVESADVASTLDVSQVIGQDDAVEGLVVAAAGGHHLAMIGAPGAGKTMLAERLPTILPPLSVEQAVELAAIESIAGDGQRAVSLSRTARFQAPHHSSSRAAIIGGGSGMPRPGAVSLAHHGVLFLDEALEFQSNVLDSLREPLESGSVLLNRTAGSARYPARFQLVLAANPCPCGNHGSLKQACRCSQVTIRRYAGRLSGPILDRIDIRMSIRPVSIAASVGLGGPLMTSEQARHKVAEARAAARARLRSYGVELNAHLAGPVLRKFLKPKQKATRELDLMVASGRTSMRGYDRCLRLAWTLADLEGADSPTGEHVQRAVSLRGSDELVNI